jgi:hypothetical protein
MTRIFAVLWLAAIVACGGGAPKKKDTTVEDDQAGETCCCRIETNDPNDPTFDNLAVMECSSRHGDCVGENRCANVIKPTEPESEPDSTPLEPSVDSPTSF